MTDYYWKLTVKGGYDPNQPRVPAGNPRGGQWTAATHSDYVQLQRDIRANYPQPVRDAIEEKVRAKFAAEGRELTEHQIEMYLDAMALGEEQFLHYGEQIGLDDPMGMFVDYNIEQKVVDMETQRQLWDMRDAASFKQRDKAAQNKVDQSWDPYYEKVGNTATEARLQLRDRYGVEMTNVNLISPEMEHEHASYLLNLAERNPAIAMILKEQVKRITYEPRHDETTAKWSRSAQEIIIPSTDEGGPVTPSTFVHELGHAADVYAGDWRRLADLGFGQGRTASLYGATNDREDWAEWFVGAFTQMPGLDRWDLDKYRAARNVLESLGGTG